MGISLVSLIQLESFIQKKKKKTQLERSTQVVDFLSWFMNIENFTNWFNQPTVGIPWFFFINFQAWFFIQGQEDLIQ